MVSVVMKQILNIGLYYVTYNNFMINHINGHVMYYIV